MKHQLSFLSALLLASFIQAQQVPGTGQPENNSASKQRITEKTFKPGERWYDDRGELVNAHGGGLLYAHKKYYWFGERRGRQVSEGVNVYSSDDLYHWKYEALALAPNDADTGSDIARGCLMERPKVIYNARTRKYVMWFHLELRGQGYGAARAAVATSDKPTGPYTFLSSCRPNGNMSRDMNLFADDDGSAYLIYSSNENYDLRLVKLTDDYLAPGKKDQLLFNKHREAPALFKYGPNYYLITSGCTGWAPNAASVHIAASVMGPWKEMPNNPMKGPNAAKTFGGQSTYVLPVAGKKDGFIFMADKWNPDDLTDSRYLWLPIQFNQDAPVIEWKNEWDLDLFNAFDAHQ